MPERVEMHVPPPSLGALLSRIKEQFADDGALGVVLVDASPLAQIERRYGASAYRGALASLAALVEELVGDQLTVKDLIVTGETLTVRRSKSQFPVFQSRAGGRRARWVQR